MPDVPLLRIEWDREGTFRARPNRFLTLVDIETNTDIDAGAQKGMDATSGGESGPRRLLREPVHVHDPGRLTELLYPGNRVLVRRARATTTRKTDWDIIAAAHEDHWILINSAYHRAIAEALFAHDDPSINPFAPVTSMNAEVTVGHSRLDFELTSNGQRLLVETKGCTLAEDGVALFPDAPTTRGRRHLETLMDERAAGVAGAAVFLVFRPDAECFLPHERTDPDFAEVFYAAHAAGVQMVALRLRFNAEDETVVFQRRIPICSG